MPFSRSRSFESMTRSATCSLARNVPACHSRASTSVVLPWSTWAMMATLRRSGRSPRADSANRAPPSLPGLPVSAVGGPLQASAGVIREPQNFAFALLALASPPAGWSFVGWARARGTPRPTPLWVAGQVALAVLLVLTGRDGGRLVHTYG